MEIRKHPIYCGYGCTQDGRVWSSKRGRWKELRVALKKNGYLQVSLFVDGKVSYKCVHRLALETFIGFCPEEMECRHLDGNRANNHLNNLCWGTRKENRNDMFCHGTISFGERNGSAKMTNDQVQKIRYLRSIGYFPTRLGKMFGISRRQVYNILSNKSWAKS